MTCPRSKTAEIVDEWQAPGNLRYTDNGVAYQSDINFIYTYDGYWRVEANFVVDGTTELRSGYGKSQREAYYHLLWGLAARQQYEIYLREKGFK